MVWQIEARNRVADFSDVRRRRLPTDGQPARRRQPHRGPHRGRLVGRRRPAHPVPELPGRPSGARPRSPSLYGLDPADVRVVCPDVGGSFGAKAGATPELLLLGELARRVGRPVRWFETRTENMTAMGHGRGQIQDVTIGGTRDGRITAYKLDVLQDAGAYPAMGALLPWMTRMMTSGVYDLQNVEFSSTSRGHHHHAARRLPGCRPPRGGRRARAGRRPVRRRDRPRPGRGAPRATSWPPDAFPYTTRTGTEYD